MHGLFISRQLPQSDICNTLEISFDITGTPKHNEVVIDAIIPKTTTMSIIFPIIPSLNFSPNIGVSVPDNFTSLVFLTYNIYPIAVGAFSEDLKKE